MVVRFIHNMPNNNEPRRQQKINGKMIVVIVILCLYQSHLGVERIQDEALEFGAVLSDGNDEPARGLKMNIIRQRFLRVSA